MTRDEAIERFYDAVGAAIAQDAAIRAALRDLHSIGMRVESFDMTASLVRVAKEVPTANDQEFLRQLRITPDIEVRG